MCGVNFVIIEKTQRGIGMVNDPSQTLPRKLTDAIPAAPREKDQAMISPLADQLRSLIENFPRFVWRSGRAAMPQMAPMEDSLTERLERQYIRAEDLEIAIECLLTSSEARTLAEQKADREAEAGERILQRHISPFSGECGCDGDTRIDPTCKYHGAKSSSKAPPPSQEFTERVAQLTAHRACFNEEHDPEHGRISGFCVVCGLPWPCPTALPKASSEAPRPTMKELIAEMFTLYSVVFTDKTSREVAIDSWAKQFAAEGRPTTEKEFRQHLWLNHGCGTLLPYGDDGEMQCCGVDFKRAALNDLIPQLQVKAVQQYANRAFDDKKL